MPDAGTLTGQGFGHAPEHGLSSAGVGAPWLVTVMRGVVVQEQAGAQRGQPAGDGVSDARAAADAGYHGDPAGQRQRMPAQLGGTGFGGSGLGWNHGR